MRPWALAGALCGATVCVGCGDGGAGEIAPCSAAAIGEVVPGFEMNPNNHLSALVTATSLETLQLAVRFVDSMGYTRETHWSNEGRTHALTVVGMRAETSYSLELVARAAGCDAMDAVVVETVEFETGALPPDTRIPVERDTSSGMQPDWYTLLGPGQRPTVLNPEETDEPYLLALDGEGEIVWYYRDLEIPGFYITRDVHQLPDGRLLMQAFNELRVIDIDGTTSLSLAPTSDEVELHHDNIPLSNGGFLALKLEEREVFSPSLGGMVTLVGDGLVEWDAAGNLVWEWSTFDHLDVDRFPGPLSSSPPLFGTEALDWTHANGLFEREDTNSYLISLRHQNWIIDVSRETGDVRWRFGPGGDFPLTGEGGAPAEWFYSQHAPSIDASGALWLYDNGNERPLAPDTYSRAVRYRLDESAMTATQEWSYETEHYTAYLGDVWPFPDGEGALVCAGGLLDGTSLAYVEEVASEANAAPGWRLGYGPDTVVYRARRIESFYPSAE